MSSTHLSATFTSRRGSIALPSSILLLVAVSFSLQLASAAKESLTDVQTSGETTWPEIITLLESFGIDLPTMMFISWAILAMTAILAFHLWNTIFAPRFKAREAKTQKTKSSEDGSSLPPSAELKSSSSSSTSATPSTPRLEATSIVGKDRDTIEWLERVKNWVENLKSTQNNDTIDTWIAALNGKSKKLTLENGILLQFLQVKHNESTSPKWHDVRIDDQFDEHMNVSCRVTCDRLALQVRATPASSTGNSFYASNDTPKNDLSNGKAGSVPIDYDIVLEKLNAPVKVVIVREESLFIVRLLDRPDVKVQIVPVTNRGSTVEKNIAPELIINGVLNVLTSTVTDLNFTPSAEFPHYRPLPSSNDNQSSTPTVAQPRSFERKLLVKIIKANNLSVSDTATGQQHQIYCTIEVDEPTRTSKTSPVRDSPSSPEWDQHFLFNINQRSNEILFEVFDANQIDENGNQHDKFLGLGIFSVAELRSNPSQKLSVPLQARPLQAVNVTGSLDVELLLMEHKNSFLDDTAEPLSSNQISTLFSKSEFVNLESESSSACSTSTTTTSINLNDHLRSRLHSDDTLANCSSLSLDSIGDCFDNNNERDSTAARSTSGFPSELSLLSSPSSLIVWPLTDDEKVLDCSLIDLHIEQSTTTTSMSSLLSTPPPPSSSSLSSKKGSKFLQSFTSLFSSSSPSAPAPSPLSALNKASYKKKKSSSPTLATSTSDHDLSISLPTISPLIGARANEDKSDASESFKTQRNERASLGTIGWLRTRSVRRSTLSDREKKKKINEKKLSLPATVLYPQGSAPPPPPESSPPIMPSLAVLTPRLSAHLKRQSIYSQVSLESINSHLEVDDDSAIDPITGATATEAHPIRRMHTLDRNSRALVPIHLTESFRTPAGPTTPRKHTLPMFDRRVSKAKSDSHLFFSLEFENYDEALKGNATFLGGIDEDEEEDVDDGIEKDRRTQTPDSSGSSVGNKKSLRRRTSNRQSLYAKFRGRGRRKTINDDQTEEEMAKSIKQKFKFRYSSKVPKRIELAKLNGSRPEAFKSALSAQHQANGSVMTVDSVLSSSASSSPCMSNGRVHRDSCALYSNCHQAKDDLSIGTMSPSINGEKQKLYKKFSKSLTNLNFFRIDNEVDVENRQVQAVSSEASSLSSLSGLDSKSSPPPPLPPREAPPRPKPSLPPYPRYSNSLKQALSTGRIPFPASHITSPCASLTSAGNYLDSSYNGSEFSDMDSRNSAYDYSNRVSMSATLPANADRPKEKKMSLMRAIRKRLSFSGKRSKSAERRSASREGSVLSDGECARSTPGSREPSVVKGGQNVANNGEAVRRHKESLANLSVSSAKTFLHDDSVLILEYGSKENMRHFVVSNPKRSKSKWRRKGTKLHLYQGHLFVARHMSNSMVCKVCDRSFARRLGKQGYQCRDCGVLVHKMCHVSITTHCPNSSIANMNLETIEDDLANGDRRSMPPVSDAMPSPGMLPEVHVIHSDDTQDRIA